MLFWRTSTLLFSQPAKLVKEVFRLAVNESTLLESIVNSQFKANGASISNIFFFFKSIAKDMGKNWMEQVCQDLY